MEMVNTNTMRFADDRRQLGSGTSFTVTPFGDDWPMAATGLTLDGDGVNLVEVFKRLYFHLYSNSSASRAERIIEDLSLLLLVKLADELAGGTDTCARFLDGRLDDRALLDHFKEASPGLFDESASFNLDAPSLRRALADLAPVSLAHAPAHVLGDAFQAIMGPRLRGERGQFFTPRSLVRVMVEVLDPRPGQAVLDPACGTAGFLREAYSYVEEKYGADGATALALVGIDKDYDLTRLASALLQISTRGHARVLNFNSLDVREWQRVGEDATAFDVILTNPPFGAKIGITDPEILATFAFGHQWLSPKNGSQWVPSPALQGTQDPQTLFLDLCVGRLKPGGKLGIVLPEGLFGNKRTGYIWDYLRSKGTIIALLDCPRTAFQPGTDTKTNVLFFERHAERGSGSRARTRIAVALTCGHDRRGREIRSDGTRHPNDLDEIGPDFHYNGQAKYWQEVELTNPYYLVPRYYEPTAAQTEQERRLIDGAERSTVRELEAGKVLSVRKGHEPGSDAYGTGDIPFVRTSDISNYEVRADPTKALSHEIYDQYARQQRLTPGDILVVADGRYRIGAAAILTENNYRCVVQSHLRILACEETAALDPYELLFALSLPSVRRRMRDLVFIQSTLGTLGNRILELEIPLLHGDGPWRSTVDRFRQILQDRDRLLADLAASGTEVEL